MVLKTDWISHCSHEFSNKKDHFQTGKSPMNAKESRAALLRCSKRKVKMSLAFRPGVDVPPKRILLVRRIAWASACWGGGAGKMVSSCAKIGIPFVSKVYSSACPIALECPIPCHSRMSTALTNPFPPINHELISPWILGIESLHPDSIAIEGNLWLFGRIWRSGSFLQDS